jgi:predicted transcriptional regulator of viral defense system
MLSTRTDAELINKTIEKYGKVVKTEELIPIFLTKFGKESAYNRIHVLSRNGWFIRIKQGLYIVNDSITGQFQGDLPFLVISHCLFEDSYVSLAHALHYHKLVDQVPDTISSISDQSSKKFSYQSYTFKITKVKPDIYFGYHTISLQKRTIQIADPEKALLDYLYVDINFTTPKVFLEPIIKHPETINIEKLQEYALRFSSNVRRKTGFLLDHLKINSKQLYASIKDSRGYTKLSKESTQFNAKWRVYYEDKHLK